MARGRSGAHPTERRIRARARTLDQLDESKLAMALWLAAKRLLEERAAATGITDDLESPHRPQQEEQ